MITDSDDDNWPNEYFAQFVLDRSGYVAVSGGEDSDGVRWRDDLLVVGWGLRVKRWRDGTKETKIVPLMVNEEDAELRGSDERGDCWAETVYLLPPNPTATDQERAEHAIDEAIARVKAENERTARAMTVVEQHVKASTGWSINRDKLKQELIAAKVGGYEQWLRMAATLLHEKHRRAAVKAAENV